MSKKIDQGSSGDGEGVSLAPHERLRADIAAVRAKFSEPDFKGQFVMKTWLDTEMGDADGDDEASIAIRAEAAAKHWCGTDACLGGWFQAVGLSGWNGVLGDENQAYAVPHYQMTNDECRALFFAWDRSNSFGAEALEEKLAQAEQIADAIEARSKALGQ